MATLALCTPLVAQDLADAPKPFGALPSERQIKWHETELYCLIHFTPTTFQDKEWGYGDADPKIFNPKHFNAEQIVGAAKAGGFRGIISVAKHHDGFALWPTKTASYNISESPFRDGKGDMVKEFQLAAQKLGMKFGVYCSPWDRNNPDYGSQTYVNTYRQQLKELYSNYGPLFMSWHDGANGGDGYYGGLKEKRKVDQSTYYDWMNTWAITREMQPDAAIFSDIGLDARWVGNEKGLAPETSWSTITLRGKEGKAPMPGFLDDSNLGEGTRHGERWIGVECDVSLRPGWFYHSSQDNQVKTPQQLFDLYCKSVGRGGALDLGLSPNMDGLLHQNDVKALTDFGLLLQSVFSDNLAQHARIEANETRNDHQARYGVSNLLDADRYSYWATSDGVHQANLVVEFPKEQKFNIIQMRENIKLGQRLDSVVVEQWQQGKWVALAHATSIGANRIIRLDHYVHTDKIRISLYAPVSITLSDLGIYAEPALATHASTRSTTSIDRTNWTITPRTLIGKASDVLDNDENTFALFEGNEITIILDQTIPVARLTYLPRQDGKLQGTISRYKLLASSDGKDWQEVAQGEFANIKANPIAQTILLKENLQVNQLKLVALETLDGKVTLSAAELYVE